jgi:hypothetical protein
MQAQYLLIVNSWCSSNQFGNEAVARLWAETRNQPRISRLRVRDQSLEIL